MKPCNPDHNGECLICDCWLKDCAWDRLWAGDFGYESFEELLVLFKDHLDDVQVQMLRTLHGDLNETKCGLIIVQCPVCNVFRNPLTEPFCPCGRET